MNTELKELFTKKGFDEKQIKCIEKGIEKGYTYIAAMSASGTASG